MKTATSYVGLQGASDGTNPASLFSSCSSVSSACDSCMKAGKAALGLYLVSFFLMIVVIITSFIRMFNDTEAVKILSVALTFLLWIFTVAGFGNWNQQCWSTYTLNPAFVDIISSSKAYNAGYGAAVTAWVFITVLFIFHLLTPVTSGDSSASSNDANPAADVSKA